MWFLFFKLWIAKSPKIFIHILEDLSVMTRKDHLTNVPSLIEIIGTKERRNDLKVPVFLVFFKMLLFEIQTAFLAGIMGKI